MNFSLTMYLALDQGGLAARPRTELRNLAEWDWLPFSFKTNMAENADMEGRWVFAGFWVFPCPKSSKKGFQEHFIWNFWTSGRVMCEQLIGDYTYRDSASREVQLFTSFVNFQATSLVSITYIFQPTAVLRTLFLILNICYELTILVWILQQSYGNVH